MSLLAKITPYALLAAAAFGWLQTEKARAREAGRVELLLQQRDSVLAVHDAAQSALRSEIALMRDSLTSLDSTRLALRKSNVVLREGFDSAMKSIRNPEVREIIVATVDTLQMECDICNAQLDLSWNISDSLKVGWDNELAQHNLTRTLLAQVREAKRPGKISLGIALGVAGIWDGSAVKIGPGVTAGVQLRIF